MEEWLSHFAFSYWSRSEHLQEALHSLLATCFASDMLVKIPRTPLIAQIPRHAYFASNMVLKISAHLIIQVPRHGYYMDVDHLFLFCSIWAHREWPTWMPVTDDTCELEWWMDGSMWYFLELDSHHRLAVSCILFLFWRLSLWLEKLAASHSQGAHLRSAQS